MPDSKVKCPKCDKSEILIGNKDEPNHCSDCGHEWKHEHSASTAESDFKIIRFKSPSVLMVLNAIHHSRRRGLFMDRLDRKLDMIGEGIALENATELTPEQLTELQARHPKSEIINPYFLNGKLHYKLKPKEEPTHKSTTWPKKRNHGKAWDPKSQSFVSSDLYLER